MNLIRLLSSLCIIITLSFAAYDRRRCWSSGNNVPARWWEDGSMIDRGKFWYICNSGELKPMGCFSSTNERMEIGQSYTQNEYEMRCDLDPEGYLQFKFTACMSYGGQRHTVGETWNDERGMYWYSCDQDGPFLKANVGGCMTHDNTKRIKLGEEYEHNGYVYRCEKQYNGTIQMCSVGCSHNGVRYKVGEQWPDGDFIFYCKRTNGRCQKICVGCQYKNKRLYDGDRYEKGDTVYQCDVRPDKFSHTPVACIVQGDNGEKVHKIIGCRWNKDLPNGKVEQKCIYDKNTDSVSVKTSGCVFVWKGYDTLFLKPRTYTIWNQLIGGEPLVVACRDNGYDQQPTIDTFKVDDMIYRTIGLKYAAPTAK
ncbi:hypothetical protein AB6A40_000519 [Gnathostoma spinigerum]|uniref:Abnormal cell migration protein 18-like fibronectin type I domain-containing protein n=1 Tax=Gnathostoma spinigerum TaxID=75299 RepID=A0ABD6E376_9BILA